MMLRLFRLSAFLIEISFGYFLKNKQIYDKKDSFFFAMKVWKIGTEIYKKETNFIPSYLSIVSARKQQVRFIEF
jgi:hypothetical protein